MRTRISKKFNRCVKSVKKTVKARKGSNKESAAIAICTKSVLQKRGRTMKRYTRKRLTTQKKFRGGSNPNPYEMEDKWWDYLTELDAILTIDPIDDTRLDTLLDTINSDNDIEFNTNIEPAQKLAIRMIQLECVDCIETLKAKGMSYGDFENMYSDAQEAIQKRIVSQDVSREEVLNLQTMLETMDAFKEDMLRDVYRVSS
jgi:hypothetical protein